MTTLRSAEVRLVERAHYYIQLSAYFSELVDLPGVRFAFTNRLTDTWYNQAYDVDWTGRQPSELCDRIAEVCASRDRAPCVYTSPGNSPGNVAQIVQESGLVSFEEESWMFFPLAASAGLGEGQSTIRIERVTVDQHLDEFTHVYRHGLPGPEVDAYIGAVVDGLRYAPAGVDVNYLLGFLDSEPVGMLSLLSMDGLSGIYAVATLESYRRRGVARALTERAVELAREKSSQYLFLQTVAGEESEEAFRRIGFQTLFTRTGFTTAEIVESMSHG